MEGERIRQKAICVSLWSLNTSLPVGGDNLMPVNVPLESLRKVRMVLSVTAGPLCSYSLSSAAFYGSENSVTDYYTLTEMGNIACNREWYKKPYILTITELAFIFVSEEVAMKSDCFHDGNKMQSVALTFSGLWGGVPVPVPLPVPNTCCVDENKEFNTVSNDLHAVDHIFILRTIRVWGQLDAGVWLKSFIFHLTCYKSQTVGITCCVIR